MQGVEQGLVYVDENFFLIKTGTSHYEYKLSDYGYNNIWLQNGILLKPDRNYKPAYELVDYIRPELQLPNTNTTYLTKISAEGAVLWTKEFVGDACIGNPFYRIDQDNFLFLTSDLYGPYYEVNNQSGGSNNTVQYPFDKNKRKVYKINSEGQVLWSTAITGIFSTEKIYLDGEKTRFQQSVTLNGDKILFNTLNTTHELSASGQIIHSFQPEYNFEGNHTAHTAKADESSNYFVCRVVTYNNPEDEFFMLKYDVAKRQTIWKKKVFNFPFRFHLMKRALFVHLS